jgi:hypothetical protein
MALQRSELEAISSAMLGDQGNSVGYDLTSQAPNDYGSFRALESAIHADLTDMDPARVHQGVVNVFVWGMEGGDRRFLSKSLETLVRYRREDKYTLAGVIFRLLDREIVDIPHLHIIKGLQLPGYSDMSFVSKLRMFLSPRRFTTMDLMLLNRLRNQGDAPTGRNLLDSFHCDPDSNGLHETSIKIDDQNEEAYRRWSLFCRRVAENEFGGHQIHGREVWAADIERALYRMARSGQGQEARNILNSHAPA